MFKLSIGFLTIILLIYKVEGRINEYCILNECTCSINEMNYIVECDGDFKKTITYNKINFSITDFNIKVSLKGRNYLDLLNDSEMGKKIKVNSLDLSLNNKNLENYLNNLNKFGADLIQLNLSYNKISRLDSEQFNNFFYSGSNFWFLANATR